MKCLRAVRPEIGALNAGSLNYLKTRADGAWAWPPMLFDNPVDKIRELSASAMCGKRGSSPSSSVSTLGIVRTAASIARNYGYDRPPKYNFVMGVESGMPADPELLPILLRFVAAGARWSVTAIGRKEIWPLHRRAAELGGDLRTGLEDTIYLPDGSRAASNGDLVKALVAIAREAGRAIASPEEARVALELSPQPQGGAAMTAHALDAVRSQPVLQARARGVPADVCAASSRARSSLTPTTGTRPASSRASSTGRPPQSATCGSDFPSATAGSNATASCASSRCRRSRAAARGGVAAGLFSHTIGAPPILHRGSEAMKARVLPQILSGEKISALAITEPSGGSDVANLRTTRAARRRSLRRQRLQDLHHLGHARRLHHAGGAHRRPRRERRQPACWSRAIRRACSARR